MSRSQQILRIYYFVFYCFYIEQFGEFGDSVADSICLDVAPQAHDDVEPGDVGEQGGGVVAMVGVEVLG